MEILIFICIFWFIASLLATVSYCTEMYFAYGDKIEGIESAEFGNYTFLPILYKVTEHTFSEFNLLGKVVMYILTTLLYLPIILVNYLIVFPLIMITWGILNFFFWLFTIRFNKKNKSENIKYVEATFVDSEEN